jgi:hypothetical protein
MKRAQVNSLASPAGAQLRGKHRAEVTEVTEGENWGGGRKFRSELLGVTRGNPVWVG